MSVGFVLKLKLSKGKRSDDVRKNLYDRRDEKITCVIFYARKRFYAGILKRENQQTLFHLSMYLLMNTSSGF